VAPLIDLLGVATDGSNLPLDPDIDTYYLMDAALFRLPVMTNAAARVRDAKPGEQHTVIEQAALLASQLAAMRSGLDKALAFNHELKGGLRVVDAEATLQTWLRKVDEHLSGSSGAHAVPLATTEAALDQAFSLADQALDNLDTLIVQRVSRMERARNLNMLVSVLCLLT
jgi:hypothetical protein